MNAPVTLTQLTTLAPSTLQQAIDAACSRIAPTWPLDRFIAVNPYWGQIERPIAAAAAQLDVLAGSPMLMPRDYYRRQWQAGRIAAHHLQAAIDAAASGETVETLLAALDAAPDLPARLPLATDLVDAQRDLGHAMSWKDCVTHHVSQCCAAWFDEGQASWGPDRSGGLYPSWRRQAAHDLGPGLLMGYPGFGARVAALPDDPQALIESALKALGVPAASHEAYLTALLLSLNGWAAWCAHQRWQARLAQGDDEQIVHLLAVRLAWEWLLHQGHPEMDVAGGLARVWRDTPARLVQAQRARTVDWIWQDALERSEQEALCRGLLAVPTAAPAMPPSVQAVFCIDVRSEVFRRALEASNPGVQTLGFAGFFGMAVSYQPLGSEMDRPQLPGLLAPRVRVTDTADEGEGLGQALAARRRQRLTWQQRWQAFRSGAGSSFSFVESCGLLYAAPLLKGALGRSGAPSVPEQTGISAADRQRLRPRVPTASAAQLEQATAAAASALRGMGLTRDFARLVLLGGHGSTSVNNPHAAGLDCGACGGQTGEVNARALALLLNDPAVRAGLPAHGVQVDEQTCFVAGLHDTTTDALQLFDTDLLPTTHAASHAADLARLQATLDEAGRRARAERAASIGLDAGAVDADRLAQTVMARATDWAQVRPEWGLVNCHAFIVAPRSRSHHLDLGGRSFLHDYDWRRDEGFGLLELIMTAPMVVTHWINQQYLASTVDPRRYGSGDKLLHNVVGGRIGVFEGNGGDLRIGLPWQSVHDGQDFRHTPLRLSVFIAAPQAPIDAILARHATVRHLVEHGWLHLFRLGDFQERQDGIWRRRPGGRWEAVDASGLGA